MTTPDPLFFEVEVTEKTVVKVPAGLLAEYFDMPLENVGKTELTDFINDDIDAFQEYAMNEGSAPIVTWRLL